MALGDDRLPKTRPEECARIRRLDREIADIGGSDAYLDALGRRISHTIAIVFSHGTALTLRRCV